MRESDTCHQMSLKKVVRRLCKLHGVTQTHVNKVKMNIMEVRCINFIAFMISINEEPNIKEVLSESNDPNDDEMS